MPRYWLFKTEPSAYSFDALERDGRTVWEGVKNPLAQQHLRDVSRGDRVLIYHTGREKAVIGVARAASSAYPDPAATRPATPVVDLVPVGRLRRPVTLAEVKARTNLKTFPLVRLPRLSVMPVTEAQWQEIEHLSRG